MIRTQVSLDEHAYRAAKAQAKRQGISVAEFVRRALARSLDASQPSERPWMRHAGSVASGDPDASTTVDDVVYRRGRP
jgi:hypothetical protein